MLQDQVGFFAVHLLSEHSFAGPVAIRPLPDLRAESLLRSILQSIDSGILLTDLEHRSLACNGRFGEIFGVNPDEAVVIGVEELRNRVTPRIVDADRWRASLDEIYADPERRSDDEITLSNGGEMVLRRISTPVFDAEGNIFGRLWTFTDITETHQRRRNTETLRVASQLAHPDPAVNLREICQTISNHFGAATQINILEGEFLRFHVHAGDLGPAAALPGIGRWDTYCGYTLEDNQVLLVQDAAQNPRFAGLLPASVGFCRYLGVPVRDSEGKSIGTLCIVDQQMDRILGPADVELMEIFAIRVNAELARERYLKEKVAESERRFEAERIELEETRSVVGTMNDAFSLLFQVQGTDDLLQAQAAVLRNVLGYSASAVFLRASGDESYEVAAYPAGSESVVSFSAPADRFPALAASSSGEDALQVTFQNVEGIEIGECLGLPWAAIARLPNGEWGEAVVVLGRAAPPPKDNPRHVVQLSAIMDGVRLVLAAHALNQGILQAQRAVLGAQERALASEKLAVVGTLAASTAHDIRNITASLSMLTAGTQDPSMASVREQLDRFSVLAHRLLSYARPGQVEQHPLEISDLLDRVLSLTAGQMRVSRVEGTLDCDAGLPKIMGDGHQLQHLFVNLVLNAVQAMDRTGGTLRLEGRATETGLRVQVIDDGPGIPASVADRLFQPFATSRAQGFGLGLFSARRIAEAHGGNIAAVSNDGQGTTMIVDLALNGGAL